MTTTDIEEMKAISTLSEGNLRNPSAGREAKLLQLRINAGKLRCSSSATQNAVQPESTDLFPDIEGLPEIPAAELTAKTLAAGILHHGALIVRGLYQPQQLERLLEVASTDEEENLNSNSAVGCSAHTLFELLEIYHDSGLLGAVRDYLGGEPVIFAERTKLRHHKAGRDNYSVIPWHQDVNFFGTKSYAINCWAAVTPCGDKNPGLSIFPRRTEQRHGWKEADGIAPLDYGNAMPKELPDNLSAQLPAVHPILQAGDALLFDEMTLHQTAVRPWVIKEQIVTISWFFRASSFPNWGTPLAV